MEQNCEYTKKELAEIFNSSSSSCYEPLKIAKFLLDFYEKKETKEDFSLCFLGIKHDKKILENFKDIKKSDVWEKVVNEKVNEYLTKANDVSVPNREKKKHIERAIKILLNFYSEKKEKSTKETLVLLAKAFLYLSKTIIPKGFSLPAKKIEALRKGIEFINNALEKNENDYELLKIKVLLYLELKRIVSLNNDENQQFIESIKKAYKMVTYPISDKNEAKILVTYAEIFGDINKLEDLINSTLENIDYEKALAAIILNKETEFNNNFASLIKELEKRFFSDPLWDDSLNLIIKAREKNFSSWKSQSIKLWETCVKIEKNISSPFLIRWYWARMKQLYDLAFLSSLVNNQNDLQINIAESIKGRTVLRLSQIENISYKSEIIRKYYEEYAKGYYGNYYINYKEIKKVEKTYHKLLDTIEINNLKPDWTYIIFYLCDIDKTFYSIIIDLNEDVKIEKFNYENLYKAYIQWYQNYQNLQLKDEKYFIKFFEEIAESMSFLSKLDSKKVLFVPHGFLHKIPIHAAKFGDNYFLEQCDCVYLPTLNLYKMSNTDNSLNAKKRILFKNFDSYDFQKIRNKFQIIYDPVKIENLKSENLKSRIITILCHGKSDSLNPFNSHLKIHGKNLTLLDILNEESFDFSKSIIILGACETDLMPKTENPVDEFITITTSFLYRGAQKVIGAMWEIEAKIIEQMIETLMDSDDMFYSFWNWQRKILKSSDTFDLSVIALRLFGT